MREIYVYWKTLKPVEARQACLHLQARLRIDHPGLEAALLLREGTPDGGPSTLMEVYRHAQGVDAHLEQHIHAAAQAALVPVLASERKVEVFSRC